jgi:hypothetical protein
MARVPIVPTAVPASQTQASQGGATASKEKKPIKAGGEEFKDIAALRMRAKELMLVTPNGTAFKAKCVELLNEHAKLLDAQRELATLLAELAIPEDEDDDDDETDADGSRRGGDDDDSSEGGSPGTLGSVGNLGNSLAVATEEDLKPPLASSTSTFAARERASFWSWSAAAATSASSSSTAPRGFGSST